MPFVLVSNSGFEPSIRGVLLLEVLAVDTARTSCPQLLSGHLRQEPASSTRSSVAGHVSDSSRMAVFEAFPGTPLGVCLQSPCGPSASMKSTNRWPLVRWRPGILPSAESLKQYPGSKCELKALLPTFNRATRATREQ